jgi:alpha-D-ribose 1-methylphosphonate 5-triphosphate synthase subunit PhnL
MNTVMNTVMNSAAATGDAEPVLAVRGLAKSFTLHLHGGKVLPVLGSVSFDVMAGECVVLGGPSGAGKSSVLKMIYGNYAIAGGSVRISHGGAAGGMTTDMAKAQAAEVLALRKHVMGYVSQFLRVIPRVAALDIVAAAARDAGATAGEAAERAAGLLARLNLPERLWRLPPATFSGGEQQRVNIARGFAGHHPLMILDEPTASLDAANSEAVVALIAERKAAGAALVGIFHDEEVRSRVADRVIDIQAFAANAAERAA